MRYVDIGAASSPWARILRATGIEAYAVDLAVPPAYSGRDYYLEENATAFAADSFQGALLQCAFEVFVGSDDIALVGELGRILAPGGRAVIAPRYTDTHACHYQTPELFRLPVADPGSTCYVRRDTWDLTASRNDGAETFRGRVLTAAGAVGLQRTLYVLRDESRFGCGIYMHFVLVFEKHKPHGDDGKLPQ